MRAKKVFIAIGVFLVVAIAALSLAPHFIDINKRIKPILIEALEKNLGAKVTMGDIDLSLFGKVRFSVDSLKIAKEANTLTASDLTLVMPYSVLTQNPTNWMKKIKMEILAEELALNDRILVISKLRSDLIKEDDIVRLKNTEFTVFDGKAKSYAEIDFSQGLKALYEVEVQNGRWPIDRLQDSLEKRVANIPHGKEMVSDIDISDRFESLRGTVKLEGGVVKMESLSMNIPKNKVDVRGSGMIAANNAMKIEGDFLLPLKNVPGELRAADGRGKIPFEILGTMDAPKLNWSKLIELVVHAYTKDEGKKIIRKEVNKLKEKLMKDERVKDLIKDIKF